MRRKIWFLPIWFIFVGAVICNDSTGKTYDHENSCWMSVKGPEIFRVMSKIDNEFAVARINAQQYLSNIDFNKRVLEAMLVNGVVARREVHKEKFHNARMPGGLQLGGQCMMRMPNTVMFFHRLALRNDTFFRMNVLHNDIANMVLKAHFASNGIHLMGAYESFITDRDSSVLRYAETFGDVQFFVEDLLYTMEGRYRLVQNRIVIELVVSSLRTKNIMMRYANASDADPPIILGRAHAGDFLRRLKIDLNKWVQDYFNSYLILTDLSDIPTFSTLRQYDEIKNAKLSVFTDRALAIINERIRTVGGPHLNVPKFKIILAYALNIKLFDGTLQGLDTMYRRSVATTTLRRDTLRYIDAIIGFKNLTISYKYHMRFPPGPKAPPPLTGVLTMSANDLMARLSLGLVSEPEVVELDIDFLNPMGSEAITVEGAGNILTSNFKNVFDHQIATLMSNALMYGVGFIRSLPRCVPAVPGVNRLRKLDIYKTYGSTTFSYTNYGNSSILTTTEKMQGNNFSNKNDGDSSIITTKETVMSYKRLKKYTTAIPKMT